MDKQARPKILIVDDKPENLYAMEKLFQQMDVEVIQSSSGSEALNLALEHDFCVAIVDIQMPEMDGYELVELLRSNEDTASLPVIFVSAIYSDEYHHRKAYETGAVDFMSKPFVPEILLSKIRVFVDLYQQRQALQAANLVLSKRALQLETSSQVSQQVSSILNLDELLTSVVKLIQAKFRYYFVSVWLLNEQQDTVALRASSGHDGSQLVEMALSLDSPRSIIVLVCRTGQYYVADDVSADPVYLAVQELPETHSELALPLQVGPKLLGALDIQSERPAVFSPEDIAVLQMLASQIAIAMQNAQLYHNLARFNEELESLVQQRTEELDRAYHMLARVDKTKSDFIAVAAHELRTPLTLIQGYASLLQTMFQNTPNAGALVEGILTGETRLLEIVNSMLDITRIDAQALKVHRDSTRLSMIVDSVRREFEAALLDRQLTLNVTGIDTLPVIQADMDLLGKLLGHLIGNAIKYTPDGGAISVRGRVISRGSPDPSGDCVEILVSDTGIGIDPDHHDMIFEKFYQTGSVRLHSSGRTKFKGGGPGLGLAIARGIVQAHGGRIWVESPGHDEQTCPGSCFHVLLPISAPQSLSQ